MSAVKPHLLLVGLASIATMAWVPVLISLVNSNEATIGLVRVLIAGLFLTPLIVYRKQLTGLSGRDWFALLVIGAVFAIHWWTYFYAIRHSTPSLGALSLSTYGIHMLWINALLRRERPRVSDIVAISLCFIGCIIVSPSLDLSDGATIAFLVGVFSGFLYAVLPFLHQRVAHLPTSLRSWGQFGFAGLFFLFLWPQMQFSLSQRDWLLLLILGVVCTLVAHTLWVKATTELPAAVSGAFYYLYIPIAMVLSYVILDEPMGFAKLLGGAIIVGACLFGILMPVYLASKKAPASG